MLFSYGKSIYVNFYQEKLLILIATWKNLNGIGKSLTIPKLQKYPFTIEH